MGGESGAAIVVDNYSGGLFRRSGCPVLARPLQPSYVSLLSAHLASPTVQNVWWRPRLPPFLPPQLPLHQARQFLHSAIWGVQEERRSVAVRKALRRAELAALELRLAHVKNR